MLFNFIIKEIFVAALVDKIILVLYKINATKQLLRKTLNHFSRVKSVRKREIYGYN